MADDEELDAMLAGLDDAVRLPSKWAEPIQGQSSVEKRHHQKDVEHLVEKLDKFGGIQAGVVPHMDPVVATTAGPCDACRKEISDAVYSSTGDGAKYHDSCFVCAKCSQKITGACEKKAGKMICAKCINLPKCKRCCEDIRAEQKFVSPEDGVQYHSGTCTTCGKCRNKLNMESIYFLRGDLYCRDCAPDMQ